MKDLAKRMLALALTAFMLVCYMPQAEAFAEGEDDQPKQESALEATREGSSDEEAAEDAADGDELTDEAVADETTEEASEEVPEEEAGPEDAGAMSALSVATDEDLGSYDSIEEIVENMTTRQKITQCLMMDFRWWNDSDGNKQEMTVLENDVEDIIEDYQFGAVILFAQNIQDTEDTLTLTKAMQKAVMKKGGLPMIIATDQEGGIVYRLGSGTALPGNMAIGATGDTSNAVTAGEIIGSELSVLGINTTLAPVMDVNNNAGNSVIGVRSFGDDPDTAGEYGKAYLSGLDEYNTIGCLKHFPGHGDTATDSHYGLPVVNKTYYQLAHNELIPFKAAIDSGADMIMTAHILYPKVDSSTVYSEKTEQYESKPATMSYRILTEILRDDLEFEGVVVTDAMDMAGVSNNFTRRQATYEALMAGADIICMPVEDYNTEDLTEKLEDVIGYIEDKAEEDEAVVERLDEAVTRILTLKQDKGILDYSASDYSYKTALETVGSDENRSKERDMAAEAVTVVRNDDDVLPYRTSENEKILMLCPYNNERAQMVMGLNRARAAGLVPESVSVEVYRFSKDDASDDSTLKEKIDEANLVIINSELYDAEDMSYGWYTSSVTKAATEYCSETGKKSVVMSVNIPYDVQLYPDADAVIAVYGAKGSAMEVTDDLLDGKITSYDKACGPNIVAGVEVIFGVYGASGTLPVNVPEFDAESLSYTDEIVYERGYGITYDALKQDITQGAVALNKTKLTYSGKTRKPSVTVTDMLGRTLTEGTDYTLTNKGRKNAGKGTVTVTGKGDYTGTVTVSYKVVPKKAAVKMVKEGRRSLTVKMTTKASKKGGSGYQIAYRVKGSSKWNYKSSSHKTIVLKKLKKGRKYEIKVRAYKKVKDVKYRGGWSEVKTSAKVK